MSTPEAGGHRVQVSGHGTFLDRFRGPLQEALGARRRHYSVTIDSVGRVGEVMFSVTGSSGRLPLLFASEDLEPAYVTRVVADSVARFGI